MDAEKFDRLTQALGAGLSRRVAMRAALGTAVLGSLGLNQSDEASAKKKKKKKKKCKNLGPCELCQKGKKKPKANGTACTPPGGTAGQCANSVCIATSPPVPPAPPSPTCVTQGNACTQTATTPATTCCAGTICGRAFGATAGTFKCCNGPGTQCSAATASECCSGGCNTNTSPATCVCKTSGTACDDNSQCCSNRCVSGTCAAAQSARG
jgi:hypothetical protein